MDFEDEIEFQNGRNVYQFNITPRAVRRPSTDQGTSWARNVFKNKNGQQPACDNLSDFRSKITGFLCFITVSILGFIRQVILNLQRPVAALISLIIFNQAVAPYMAAAVVELLQPLCQVPLIGRVCPSANPTPLSLTRSAPTAAANSHAVMWADYPALMELQTKTIHQLYDAGAGGLIGSSLSADMRKSQMVTSDLVVLVNVSNFLGKDDIAGILGDLSTDAKDLTKALTGLEVGMTGAFNRIVTVNNFAIKYIEDQKNRSLRAIIGDWFSKQDHDAKTLAETFEYVMSVLGTELGNILLRCDVIQGLLDLTDAKLSLLHELLQREQIVVTAANDELLAQLWTMLGGNKRRVHDLRAKLQLLKDLSQHRRDAQLIVAAVTQGVGVLIEDLEQLRIRVAQPAIEGSILPSEVQLQSIKAGVEHIQTARYFMQNPHLGKASNSIYGEGYGAAIEQ